MSESMAFIGGVAVAGLAALVLLKGTNTPLQPNFAVAPQMPTNMVAPQFMQQPGQYSSNYGQQTYPNTPTTSNTEQRVEVERLKMDLERLKSDNEQQRVQYQQLQFQVQNYNNQQSQFAQQQSSQKAVAATTLPTQTPWWSSPIVWAVGGMSLTIGGGVVVAGVLALFSPRQRSGRTVQVIHPYQGRTQPLTPIRRAEFLPPGLETRRVEAPHYDEMH